MMPDCSRCKRPILGVHGWIMREGRYFHHDCNTVVGVCAVCGKNVHETDPRVEVKEPQAYLHVDVDENKSCYLKWLNSQTTADE